MSRIGRAPITVPAGVEITVGEGNHITGKGPKGTLERKVAPQMLIEIENGVLHVKRPNDEKQNCALHGLTRTLVNDMVVAATMEGLLSLRNAEQVAVYRGKSADELKA